MRHAWTILAAVAALPLLAGEPAKAKTAPASTETQASATTTAAEPQRDSPLVAAARRTNRLGRKPANVITNQTLTRIDKAARITTTTDQRTLNMPAPAPPPPPTPEMVAAKDAEEKRKSRQAVAQKQRAEEEARQRKLAEAAARADEGHLAEGDADPARAEQELETAQPEKPPQG